MESFLWIIGLGISSFSVTNIDDLFVLAMFYANPAFSIGQIVSGQYIGISLLIAISAASYFAALIIPAPYVGLLGFLPIILGIRHLAQLKMTTGEEAAGKDNGETSIDPGEKGKLRFLNFLDDKTVSVATVTLANGGDNIGVYVPLFAGIGLYQMLPW